MLAASNVFALGAFWCALGAALLLGLNCGLLGSFLVVRRLSLIGDTLAHAVLPGIVGGYLWSMTKNPLALLVGALGAGVLASALISAITATTKLHTDAALGIVMAVFFSLGVCFISMLPDGPNKSGLNHFLFGQIAALSGEDLKILALTAGLNLCTLAVFYRGMLVLSFDTEFGKVAGLPMRAMHFILMSLTTWAAVVSMEAVGVVLVSALMVIPAAAASLLTNRLHRMLAWSAGIGMLSGVTGVLVSARFNWPAGATIVLAAAVVFLLAFLFSPRYGWGCRLLENWKNSRRINRENALKAAYRVLEQRDFRYGAKIFRGECPRETATNLPTLIKSGLAKKLEDGQIELTPQGLQEARRVIRNHRLWELYLSQRAKYPADHVHADAERVEHSMTDEHAQRLMELLGNPTVDPHGRPIPNLAHPEVIT